MTEKFYDDEAIEKSRNIDFKDWPKPLPDAASEFNPQSIDAVVWAKEFMRIFNLNNEKLNYSIRIDEDTMRGWFANSTMAGYNEANRRIEKEVPLEFPPEHEVSEQYYKQNNNLTQEAKEANALNLGYNQARSLCLSVHQELMAERELFRAELEMKLKEKEAEIARLKETLAEEQNENNVLRKNNTSFIKEMDNLRAEIALLKQGICEHAAQDKIVEGCRLCELAIADKGYKIWVKKAECYREALGELLEVCKKARIFIKYARYELDDGLAKIGGQFPKKEDADNEIKRLEQTISKVEKEIAERSLEGK